MGIDGSRSTASYDADRRSRSGNKNKEVNMKKTLVTSLAILSIAGCATPQTSEQALDFYSRVLYYSAACHEANLLDRETAAKGIAWARSNYYANESDKVRAKAEALHASGVRADKSNCDQLALRILSETNKPAAQPRAAVQQPRYTNCSTYFGQTFCTSY